MLSRLRVTAAAGLVALLGFGVSACMPVEKDVAASVTASTTTTTTAAPRRTTTTTAPVATTAPPATASPTTTAPPVTAGPVGIDQALADYMASVELDYVGDCAQADMQQDIAKWCSSLLEDNGTSKKYAIGLTFSSFAGWLLFVQGPNGWEFADVGVLADEPY
jgi:hypothetical protein